MKRMKRKPSMAQSYTGRMLSMGIGNMVGATMVGATAGVANAIPAGMAHDMAGLTAGLQATSMLGPNIRVATDSMVGRSRARKAKKVMY